MLAQFGHALFEGRDLTLDALTIDRKLRLGVGFGSTRVQLVVQHIDSRTSRQLTAAPRQQQRGAKGGEEQEQGQR